MDKGRSFHIFCGHILCILAVCHCGAHLYNAIFFSKHYNSKYKELNVAKYADQNPLLMLVTTIPGITGLLLVVSLVVIAGFALRPTRRHNHSRFWATHHLFVVYYALLFLHAMDGVLKYQINLEEHVPGCMVIVKANKSEGIGFNLFPLPEPYAEPHASMHFEMKTKEKLRKKRTTKNQDKALMKNTKMKKKIMKKHSKSDLLLHQAVIPEPEPMPLGDKSEHFSSFVNASSDLSIVKINGSWMTATTCKQPPPKFASCPKEVWKWLCVPLSLYILERLMRLFYSSRFPAKIEGFRLHPDDVLELRLSKNGFKAKPGQSILVRCPAISNVELHPFSLTSVPSQEDKTFGIHIKILGDWTRNLAEILHQVRIVDNQLSKGFNSFSHTSYNRNSQRDSYFVDVEHFDKQRMQSDHVTDSTLCNNEEEHQKYLDKSAKLFLNSEATNQPTLYTNTENENKTNEKSWKDFSKKKDQILNLFIEGPIGSAMEDIFKYKVALCVAGGIGVTPFASVLNKLLVNKETLKKTKLNRLYLIWSCKTLKSFQWFINVIEKLHLKLWEENRPDFFTVQLYLTSVENIESSEASLSRSSILKRSALHYHRPKMDEIIQDVSNRHKKSTVGVFSCGPRSLITSVGQSCSRAPSKNRTIFMFNKEAF